MKRINSFPIVACILSFAALFSFSIFAETQKNFSGKWSFNQAKSKAAEGTSFSGAEVALDILHETNSITITETIKNTGGMIDTTTEKYSLDGKESETSEKSIITKLKGNWLTDRIILIKSVSLGTTIFTTENVYSLSDNGKVLTIQSTETMNSKKSNILLVYDKK